MNLFTILGIVGTILVVSSALAWAVLFHTKWGRARLLRSIERVLWRAQSRLSSPAKMTVGGIEYRPIDELLAARASLRSPSFVCSTPMMAPQGPRIPGTKVALPRDVQFYMAARDRSVRAGTIIIEDGMALMVLDTHSRICMAREGEWWRLDSEEVVALQCVSVIDVIEAMQRAGEPVPANWEAALKLEDWA